jgi:stage II sporulation protein D
MLGAPVFVVNGGGYGHGVGMSQWGACGQAQAGRSYGQILAHYYRGTQLGTASVSSIRVLLAEKRRKLVVASEVPFRIRDAAGSVFDLPAARLELGPDLVVSLDRAPTLLAGPLVFLPGKGAPLSLDGVPYRGRLRLFSDGSRLQVVNVLGLEAYLMGVVGREMPAHWPIEALKAQAVAARSYTLAKRSASRAFDVYGDVRSLAYGGIPAESSASSDAVRETAGRVLLYEGRVATTFFFSSSGGRTASSVDVFGFDRPYLRAVPDPWDAASPNHAWQPRTLTPAALAKAFRLSREAGCGCRA